MAINQTITQSRQIQNNTLPEVAVTQTVEAFVENNVLTPGYRNLNPGVFTAGTTREGTSTNNGQ